MADDRSFVVGETVVCSAKVSEPKTRKPVDPADGVVLICKTVTGTPVTLPGAGVFTRLRTGDYEYRLDTTGMVPATTYEVEAIVANGALDVRILQDRFALVARI